MTAATQAGLASNRVHSLDALRGLLAISVLLYHLVGGWPSVVGTWGVYTFFAISGYALDHVYRGRFDLRAFAVARIARLAPLWVPVVLVSAVLYGNGTPALLALNLTGAFGLVLPGLTAIPGGGWSIGIEACCYLLFPLLLRCSTRTLAVLAIATLAMRVVWVNLTWPPGVPLTEAWVAYTQLPAFLVFFVVGMLASRGNIAGGSWVGRPARVAAVLGDLSYGTYLLGFIVWAVAGPVVALATPVIALAVFRWYEVPAGRWIKRRLRPRVLEPLVVEVGVADGSGVRPDEQDAPAGELRDGGVVVHV